MITAGRYIQNYSSFWNTRKKHDKYCTYRYTYTVHTVVRGIVMLVIRSHVKNTSSCVRHSNSTEGTCEASCTVYVSLFLKI